MRKQEGAEEVLHLARYDDDDVAITTLHAHYFDGAGRGVARDKPVCRGFNATHDRASYVARATKLASELEALDGVRGYHYGDGAAIGTKTGARALDVFVEVETLRALEWSDFCRSGVARHDRLSYVLDRYVARDASTARAADRTVADPGGAAHAVASASGCDAACATWVAGAANYEKVAAAFLGPTTAAMIASGVADDDVITADVPDSGAYGGCVDAAGRPAYLVGDVTTAPLVYSTDPPVSATLTLRAETGYDHDTKTPCASGSASASASVCWPDFFHVPDGAPGLACTDFEVVPLSSSVAVDAAGAVFSDLIEVGASQDGGLAGVWTGFVAHEAVATYDLGCGDGAPSTAADRFAFAEIYLDLHGSGFEAKQANDFGCSANDRGVPLVYAYNFMVAENNDFPPATAARLAVTGNEFYVDGFELSAVTAQACNYTGLATPSAADCAWA